jgi:hypothetical protein
VFGNLVVSVGGGGAAGQDSWVVVVVVVGGGGRTSFRIFLRSLMTIPATFISRVFIVIS